MRTRVRHILGDVGYCHIEMSHSLALDLLVLDSRAGDMVCLCPDDFAYILVDSKGRLSVSRFRWSECRIEIWPCSPGLLLSCNALPLWRLLLPLWCPEVGLRLALCRACVLDVVLFHRECTAPFLFHLACHHNLLSTFCHGVLNVSKRALLSSYDRHTLDSPLSVVVHASLILLMMPPLF